MTVKYETKYDLKLQSILKMKTIKFMNKEINFPILNPN